MKEELDVPTALENAKGYVLLIGWTGMEVCARYRKSQSFKEDIQSLQAAKHLKGMDSFYFSAKAFQRTECSLEEESPVGR